MSAYNLLETEIMCDCCTQLFDIDIQFKFGDTWQFSYGINDKIKRGGNDIGYVNLRFVKVYGIAERSVCPTCGYKNSEEYDINIKLDRIVSIEKLENISFYNSDPEGNYFIVEN